MGAWNWLDWLLAVILTFSVVTAILKGFVRELVALAALVAGLIIAVAGYRQAAGWFEDIAKSHEIALGLGFLSLFVGTLIVGALVGALAWRLVRKAELEWFDRFLGGLFGLARGVLFDCVILLAMVAFAIKPGAVKGSSLAPYLAAGARVIALATPQELRTQFRTGFEKFRSELAAGDKQALKARHD